MIHIHVSLLLRALSAASITSILRILGLERCTSLNIIVHWFHFHSIWTLRSASEHTCSLDPNDPGFCNKSQFAQTRRALCWHHKLSSSSRFLHDPPFSLSLFSCLEACPAVPLSMCDAIAQSFTSINLAVHPFNFALMLLLFFQYTEKVLLFELVLFLVQSNSPRYLGPFAVCSTMGTWDPSLGA